MHATIHNNRNQRARIQSGWAHVNRSPRWKLDIKALAQGAEERERIVTQRRERKAMIRRIRKSLIGSPPVQTKRNHNRAVATVAPCFVQS